MTNNPLFKIPFGGDFRPYFTIQDSDFKSISNRNRVKVCLAIFHKVWNTKTFCKKAIPTGLVLGVTNPVFSKALENWPHLIKVAKVPTKAAAPPTSMTPEPSAEIKS